MNLQVVASIVADVGVFASAVELTAVRPPLILLIDVSLVHAGWLAGGRVSVGGCHTQSTWMAQRKHIRSLTLNITQENKDITPSASG
jgi:hypothetical protein